MSSNFANQVSSQESATSWQGMQGVQVNRTDRRTSQFALFADFRPCCYMQGASKKHWNMSLTDWENLLFCRETREKDLALSETPPTTLAPYNWKWNYRPCGNPGCVCEFVDGGGVVAALPWPHTRRVPSTSASVHFCSCVAERRWSLMNHTMFALRCISLQRSLYSGVTRGGAHRPGWRHRGVTPEWKCNFSSLLMRPEHSETESRECETERSRPKIC